MAAACSASCNKVRWARCSVTSIKQATAPVSAPAGQRSGSLLTSSQRWSPAGVTTPMLSPRTLTPSRSERAIGCWSPG